MIEKQQALLDTQKALLDIKDQHTLLRSLVAHNVLKFGSFTLKSGRQSPYFLDFGALHNGALVDLSAKFANLIEKLMPNEINSEKELLIFGPAYKGIPLAIATASVLAKKPSTKIGWFFNRKEEKKHGEGGRWVGQTPKQDSIVIMIDDVLTDGKTKLETLKMLKQDFGIRVKAVFIAFHRMEKSISNPLAEKNIHVYSLLNLDSLKSFIKDQPKDTWQKNNSITPQEALNKLADYQSETTISEATVSETTVSTYNSKGKSPLETKHLL